MSSINFDDLTVGEINRIQRLEYMKKIRNSPVKKSVPMCHICQPLDLIGNEYPAKYVLGNGKCVCEKCMIDEVADKPQLITRLFELMDRIE